MVTGLVVLVVMLVGAWGVQAHVGIVPLKRLVAPLLREQARAPLMFAAAYFAAYVATTALCIPLEVPFALVAGALFGLAGGVVLASFASAIGATLAFLGARYLLRRHVRRYFGAQFQTINQGFARDGIFYLINMRLTPIVPFSLCNPLMGLTTMRVGVFYIVSQICMIFATLIFVNAGTQLLSLRSFGDIISPSLVLGLAALAMLPWLGRGLVHGAHAFRRRTAAAK